MYYSMSAILKETKQQQREALEVYEKKYGIKTVNAIANTNSNANSNEITNTYQYPQFPSQLPANVPKKIFIIPYRNRKEHLNEFIRRFTEYIKDKDIDVQFYIIHQINVGEFNRGAMKNIGFLEICKIRPDGLFIFHECKYEDR